MKKFNACLAVLFGVSLIIMLCITSYWLFGAPMTTSVIDIKSPADLPLMFGSWISQYQLARGLSSFFVVAGAFWFLFALSLKPSDPDRIQQLGYLRSNSYK
jgi:hypothetical protein